MKNPKASQKNRVAAICYLIICVMVSACAGGGSSSGGGQSSVAQSTPTSSSSLTNNSSVASTATSSTNSSVIAGLSTRPTNTTCLAPSPITSGGTGAISFQPTFTSLPKIDDFSGMIQIPGDNTKFYALRQTGFVVRFDNSPSANSLTTVLDIQSRVLSGGERGLLGIAFHPNFTINRFAYLYYSGRDANGSIETRVSRFTLNSNGVFDANSELILLKFSRPFNNHVGGAIAFRDGYLFIASGDGGSGGDPQQNGQNTNTLLGKILRIDVDNTSAGKNYGIPADNPFATGGGSPEIYAYGLRNPWRFSFDRESGEFWVGDVGQDLWEEIDVVTRGGNYGWGDVEGNVCYRSNCSMTGKIKPIAVWGHSEGACAIIGGYVYRGTQNPSAVGKYFYTDYCSNSIRSLTNTAPSTYTSATHGAGPGGNVSFAEDNQGEIYVISQSNAAGSQISKLTTSGGTQTPGSFANKLSNTGCVINATPTQPATGLIPFDVQTALWSDGAAKDRYFGLPQNSKIDLTADGDFSFPVGTVLMKNFRLNNKLIETRLFARGQLGWQGASYEWADDQSDANLLNAAKDKNIGGVDWHYPSSEQCLNCHTQAANFSLGLETLQLNHSFTYASTNITANQLNTYEAIGLFNTPPTSLQKSKTLSAITDVNKSVTERARSYLHSNCSGCHRPGGPTTSTMDLRYDTAFTATNTCNQTPLVSSLGLTNAKIISPGVPASSVLLTRMNARDANQMPPLGTHLVDTEATKIVSDWITGLTNCN